MKLVEINRLGFIAGFKWLDDAAVGRHRRLAKYEYDNAATDEEKAAIQAAWSFGWNFGYRNSEKDLKS